MHIFLGERTWVPGVAGSVLMSYVHTDDCIYTDYIVYKYLSINGFVQLAQLQDG